jgi:hypothetical protein
VNDSAARQAPAFSVDERALMDEAAQAVVRRRLAMPAMMLIETLTPMNMVTASMLHVLTPVWRAALPASLVERLAPLLERRDAQPELVRVIDEAEHRRRQAEADEQAEHKASRTAAPDAARAGRRRDRRS